MLLNTLVPMEDLEGNRCFTNQWDVKARQDDGWKVIGKLEHHNASVLAPTQFLTKEQEKTDGKAPVPSAGGDTLAVERARVRAILKAADGAQFELADKLIAEGKTEAEALQLLAADRERRKAKPDPKGKPGKDAVGEQADTTVTPPAK